VPWKDGTRTLWLGVNKNNHGRGADTSESAPFAGSAAGHRVVLLREPICARVRPPALRHEVRPIAATDADPPLPPAAGSSDAGHAAHHRETVDISPIQETKGNRTTDLRWLQHGRHPAELREEVDLRDPALAGAPVGRTQKAACAPPGADCRRAGCCRFPGTTCFERDAGFAECRDSCGSGAVGNSTVKALEGGETPWPWSCTVLGGYVAPPLAAAPAGAPVPTSLLCVLILRPRGEDGADERMIKAQRAAKVGAFACDASDVLRAERGVDVGSARAMADALESIRRSGRYLRHDWTVRVNPDAVFLPGRLKHRLRALHPPAGEAVYIQSWERLSQFGAALTVFNTQALEVYFERGSVCARRISRQSGKDTFVRECLDSLGALELVDAALVLSSSPLGAHACKHNKTCEFDHVDTSVCADIRPVAFSAYKEEAWDRCLAVAMAGLVSRA